ncbi:MAG: hypothetical protein AABY18_02885 [Candidatus Thermoplasmatota archaeon]
MLRLRAAAVLLLVAAAWAPVAHAGTAADPELEDAAGDQAVTRPGGPDLPPLIPGVNDESFDDIDLVAAWFEQPRTVDCVGENALDCPDLALLVATTASWTTGTLTATFRVERGPTSYAASTATGQTVTLTVTGTTVTGLPNATAAVGPDGLRIQVGIGRVGAVGGDLLTGLNLTTTRTDLGAVTDPTVTQDDQTGTDAAGPGANYTMARPTPTAGVDVGVAQVGNKTGNALTTQERGTYDVRLRISNLGTDADAYTLAVSSDPPLKQPPVLSTVAIPLAGDAQATVPISLAGMDPGTIRVTFTVTTTRGATDTAVAVFSFAPPASEREVVPAGLDFMTPAAESLGLDGAFGKYAELVLLALIVLLVILAIFLLVALAPSTLAGSAAPEAPPMKGGDQAPAGLLPLVAPAKKADADDDEPEDEEGDGGPTPPAATVGGALKIESVTHEPEAPEEGEEVTTEVVLRNPGPSRQVRVVLAADDLDRDEAALTLAARATKTVRLSWTAGPGENRVRVRVLPA